MTGMVEVVVNGQQHSLPDRWTIGDVVSQLISPDGPVAVELNREILRRDLWMSKKVEPGDQIEVVHFVGGGEATQAAPADELVVAGCRLHSRLIVGTGKYESNELMRQALLASGSEMVTVAVRRVDLSSRGNLFSTTLTGNGFTSCPTPRGAIPPKKRFAMPGWGGRPAFHPW